MPGVVGQYVETIEQSKAEETVARFTGEHYEGMAADLYDRMRNEREFIPNISVGEAYQRAAERLINDIQTYDKAVSESEFQSEARSLREGIHIDQFHARYESPDENASEYQQNLHADESVDFVERQLRAMDRQFPDATEIEKLQMTESKLGLDHSQSERLLTQYGGNTETVAEREKESPAFREAFNNTTERLQERYFNASTSNGWDAASGQATPWTNAQDREVVQRLAHDENRFIAKAQFETPGGRYQTDDSYRLGAREAVMEFSRENNHRLLQSERENESPRESIRLRVG